MAAPSLIDVKKLRVHFATRSGAILGVEDVSFRLVSGETLCMVGESGSGKSVSALSLLRLVEFGGGQITEGSLYYHDQEVEIDLAKADGVSMRQIRGRRIGMVFQEPMTALNPVFTIGYQLMEGLRNHFGLSVRQARERSLALLHDVRMPEPAQRLKQYPHELSGGMRQRVLIAMAMACDPQVLICDEPTTALDVTVQAEILALIDRLKREHNMAVLFITHDMAVVAQIADRVCVMFRGRLVEEGTVQEIFARPQKEYTRSLLAAVPRLGEMHGKEAPEPIRIGGTAGTERKKTSSNEKQELLLDVQGLTTRYPIRKGLLRRVIANVHSVEDVSFSLARGQTLGLVGESGCGKSSCGRSLLRLVEPMRGIVRLDGQDVIAMDDYDLRAARRNMQMIFQDPLASFNPQARLVDQVAEPLRNYNIARGAALMDLVASLFEQVGLSHSFLRRYPHELSGGQCQRAAIARALALKSDLIVADEAVSALDVSVQAQVLDLMMELQAKFGIAILFISHDMAVVERISHAVAVMYFGRIVEMGPRAAVFENPQHEYTKSLLSAVPVADPRQRKRPYDVDYKPVSAPIYPVGHEPTASIYEEVGPRHLVLKSELS